MSVGYGAMRSLPGGDFLMGSDRFYPEEAPARPMSVGAFRIDAMAVTNAAFAAFVAATGHATEAEQAADGPAGSLVFRRHGEMPVPEWAFVAGASWRCPGGPGSSTEGLDHHPVVHVTRRDAEAYARWAGKRLPTEAEWEFAARGGLHDADYGWGDVAAPDGVVPANIWQGLFPVERRNGDGFPYTLPVGSHAPNGYGLHDMAGNVWEWTATPYAASPTDMPSPCCGGTEEPAGGMPHVIKGGSHLCADNYCLRYRPAARQPGLAATSHIGFRCAV